MLDFDELQGSPKIPAGQLSQISSVISWEPNTIKKPCTNHDCKVVTLASGLIYSPLCETSIKHFYLISLNLRVSSVVSMGVDRWGTGGDASPPHFSAWWGPHRKCPPPLFCLKSRKYHVCSSSSNIHSFVRLRNRHMFICL